MLIFAFKIQIKMTYILHFESSTSVCSVSLSRDGKLVDLQESTEGQNHARLMAVFANEIINRNKLTVNQLSAIAVSQGPGSYTGLRIGVSLAKGLCFANELPLIAVSPLQAMCSGVIQAAREKGEEILPGTILMPMIDARRMEVYTAQYDVDLQELKPVSSIIIDEHSFITELREYPVWFFGNGADKCTSLIKHPNALFVPGIFTSAQFMCGLAYQAFTRKQVVDLAYFEPFYLKDFIAGTPKKII